MLQTNIVAASSPVLPASPGPTAAGEGKATSPEGTTEPFANVLGRQERDLAAKAQADAPAAEATDAAAVPWPPPPGAGWLAAAQSALLGKDGASSSDRRTDEDSTARADSAEGGIAILTALPAPSGPAGMSTVATAAAAAPQRAMGLPAEGAALSLPPAPAPAAAVPASATAAMAPAFAVAGTTDDSPALLAANLAAGAAADTAKARDIAAMPTSATPASGALGVAIHATDAGPRAPEPDGALPLPTMAPGHPGSGVTAATSQTELHIATPVGGRQWESAVGNSLVLMTGNRQQHAELVLTPPQLGRIEVSLSMAGDQATAVFVSPNPAVRDAIESAMPRLREILADAGVTLGQVQVGAESFRQSAGNRENGDNSGRTAPSGRFGDSGPTRVVAAIGASALGSARSLVDVFV